MASTPSLRPLKPKDILPYLILFSATIIAISLLIGIQVTRRHQGPESLISQPNNTTLPTLPHIKFNRYNNNDTPTLSLVVRAEEEEAQATSTFYPAIHACYEGENCPESAAGGANQESVLLPVALVAVLMCVLVGG
ncbi:hypothetical protein MMC12_002112 [Toensbergia leucococca]|nr:hypothetical protein [Toensbergia leucococca]